MRQEPRTIPNPLYCHRCDGLGYLVADAEWEPYAVQCSDCAERRRIARRAALSTAKQSEGA